MKSSEYATNFAESRVARLLLFSHSIQSKTPSSNQRLKAIQRRAGAVETVREARRNGAAPRKEIDAMLEIKSSGHSIDITFSSDFALMDKVLSQAEKFMKKLGCDSRKGRTIIRELIRNAIGHGNHEHKSRHVHLNITCFTNTGFKIRVTDEGMGFGYQNLELELPAEPGRNITDRGYKLINAHSNRLEFNDIGNAVTVCVNGAHTKYGESSSENIRGATSPATSGVSRQHSTIDREVKIGERQ